MKITGETLINNVHFARFIVLVYHSIPKINWKSFRGQCEEKWGSFRGWGSFRAGIIEDAVQHFKTSYNSSADQKAFTGFLLSFKMS